MLEKIMNRYSEYHPKKNSNFIEIPNDKGDSLWIEFDGEITLLHGDWHCHYPCEDMDDLEEVMHVMDSILKNQECHLEFYYDGKLVGSGSMYQKEKYTEEEVISFLEDFLGVSVFGEVTVHFAYWDSSKDYEMILNV
ncbi:MAG: hypothetical protein J6X28_01080 [Bacilli bacterium]|nr:hypothetical protein [Bacilli bacterium]